jgi:hypothetical protein
MKEKGYRESKINFDKICKVQNTSTRKYMLQIKVQKLFSCTKFFLKPILMANTKFKLHLGDHKQFRNFSFENCDIEELYNYKVPEKKLASGTNGATYAVCAISDDKNCNKFIMKTNVTDHEITNQEKAANLGFAPKIVNNFDCETV